MANSASLGIPAVVSGLVVAQDALVSFVRWHVLSSIQQLVIRLSSLLMASTLNVKQQVEGDDAGGPLFTPAHTRFPRSGRPPSHVSLTVFSERIDVSTLPV
jgi:hypothetical protein